MPSMYRHADRLGAGAKKRRTLHGKQSKIRAVMGEYKRGTLRSGSGHRVSNPQQAKAIALSEARRAGYHVPPPKSRGKLTRKRLGR